MNRLKKAFAAPLAAALALAAWTVPATGAPESPIKINEVVTNKDPVADWVELVNTSDADIDIAGWTAIDNGKKSKPITFPAGTIVVAGSYYSFYTEEGSTPDGSDGFGLGKDDSITISDSDGNVVAEFSWGPHAEKDGKITSWGRLPDKTGEFGVTGESTRNAPNKAPEGKTEDPATPTFDPKNAQPLQPATTVVINEIESNGDPVADWVELYNTGDAPVDISGWLVIDNDDKHAPLVFPGSTVIAPKSFLRFYTEGAEVLGGGEGFGLGKADSVRIFTPKNELAAEASWKEHANETFGRVPDGTGDFVNTLSTPGAANGEFEEPKPQPGEPWPNDSIVVGTVDLGADFAVEDMSGVDFDENGRAWIVNNGDSKLFAVDYDEAKKTYSLAGQWTLRYPDGTGKPDSEGISVGDDGALYVATERDNANKNESRPSVLRFEIPSSASGELKATQEWNLKNHVGEIGANAGLEAVEHIEGNVYAVGVEASGEVLLVELGADGESTLKQRYKSPFQGVMALDWDADAKQLRALCDEVCFGQSILLKYNSGELVEDSKVQDRPSAMTENYANEGYAKFTKVSACKDGKKTTTTRHLWTDDGATGKVALRSAIETKEESCETPGSTSGGSDWYYPAPAPSTPATSTAPSTTSTTSTTTTTTTPATTTPGATTPDTTAVEPGSLEISQKCVDTLTGWGVSAALLIPAALLAQFGLPLAANLLAPVNDVFAQFNAAAQAQIGFFNPALAAQTARLGYIAAQAGPLLAALALGITAVATIADSCGNTSTTTVATTARLVDLSSR